VQIGRSHHWTYDAGDWKETKITPDLWEVSYAVTKRKELKFKLAHKRADRGKWSASGPTQNDKMGIIRYGKSGWKMDMVKDQKLVDAIGAEIAKYFGEEPE